LLAAGISYREFSDVARVAFVRVASKEYGIRGRLTNVSRVAAMTGITRKDVSRIRLTAEEYENDLRIELTPLGDVLHYWHTDPTYLDARGRPKVLPFSGSEQSFVALVRKHVGDVPTGAIRAELIRSGAIAIEEGDLLRATRRYVVPEGSHEKLASAISFSLRSLAETIAFNSSPARSSPARVERFVQSNCLKAEAIDRVRDVLREKIALYSQEVDDLFSQHESHGQGRSHPRLGVGLFYYEDTFPG
jgi:hypothetical protein